MKENLLKILKNKKLVNIVGTIVEIAIVAGIILGALLFIQSRLKNTNGNGFFDFGDISKEEDIESQEAEDSTSGGYYLEANMKKMVLIVYEYNKDKSEKKAIAVYAASMGEDLKAGTYKIGDKYQWVNTKTNNWNKYSSYFSEHGCIQSPNFREKYSWTLYTSSYAGLGKEKQNGSGIKVSASAAYWIYCNCHEGTELKVVKGKKDDKLPLEITELPKYYASCGWDPTDPQKGNPYKKVKKGSISAYEKTIYVEAGTEPDYYHNIIALDATGSNISENVKHDDFDYNELGSYDVKYTYKKGKLNFKVTLKYKVIDTTPPVVSVPDHLTVEIKSVQSNYLHRDDVKEAIENAVKAKASSNEGTITVTAIPKTMIELEGNYVRVVAVDSSGNVGSAQCIVDLVSAQKELNTSYVPKDEKNETGGVEEKTTKNKKNKDKKKDKEKTTTQETQTIQETSTEEPTVAPSEENTEVENN